MLLPEHRDALKGLIDRIYNASPYPSDGLEEPLPGVINHHTLSTGLNGAAAYEQLTAEIVTCVRIQCARQMRVRNRAVVPPQCQLPVEIWATVFARLARHDLVSASHVSRDWREAAMASGQLWTSPFFFSAAHAADCDCQDCRTLGPCRNCGSISRSKYSPVDQVQTFLARSGSFPVNLKMSMFSRAARSTLADLNAIVQPHIHRIDSLDFYSTDLDVTIAFLELLDSFSALRSLTLELDFHVELTWECARPAQLPELKSIKTLGPLYCHHDRPFELRCFAVTSLDTIFHSASHLLPLLKACPAVQHLQLKVGPRMVDTSTSEVLKEVHALLKQAHLSEVQLTNAYEGDIGSLLAIFNTTGIPNIAISLSNGEHILEHELTRFLCDEVERPVRLECVLIEDNTAVYNSLIRLTTSNTTHERTCTLSIIDQDEFLRDIWGRLSRPSFENIHKLRASSFLWPSIFYTDEQLDALPMTHVHINIDGGDNILTWLQRRATAIQGGTERSLPQLEVLRFSLVTPHQSLQLDAALVDAIREAFCLSSKLQLLELEGFALEGDLTMLHAFSHEVVVV